MPRSRCGQQATRYFIETVQLEGPKQSEVLVEMKAIGI
jgi:hypothetical protein